MAQDKLAPALRPYLFPALECELESSKAPGSNCFQPFHIDLRETCGGEPHVSQEKMTISDDRVSHQPEPQAPTSIPDRRRR